MYPRSFRLALCASLLGALAASAQIPSPAPLVSTVPGVATSVPTGGATPLDLPLKEETETLITGE